MNSIDTKTVGQIVSENFHASDVFYKYGIDYFNQQSSTLAEACKQQQLNIDNIEQEIRKTAGGRRHQYNKWEPDYLIDYIQNTHHYFAWINLPVIREYALKVARAQGRRYPATIEVNRLFKEFASEIEHHLSDQEQRVFPEIKRLIHAVRDGEKLSPGVLNLLVPNLEPDYQYFITRLRMAIDLLSGCRVANERETTPGVLLYKLKALQNDLYQHIYLEKNVLVPKVLALGKSISD